MPIACVRGPVDGDVAAFVCSCAPRQPPARGGVRGLFSVERGGLPAECGELACAGDRDDAGVFAAALTEVCPACVQTLLRAPGDLHDARVLAGLAGCDALADSGTVTVVVRRLDEQSARVRRAGLRD